MTRATRLRPPGTGGADEARGLAGAAPGLEAYRIRVPLQSLRRWIFLGLTAGTTGTGGWLMLGILGAGGVSPLELVILLLFVPTFGWISIPFWNAVIGFLLALPRRDPLTLARERSPGGRGPRIRSRTALVMPARNEDPARVFGGLAATLLSLEETGQAERFDLHLLSDSTDHGDGPGRGARVGRIPRDGPPPGAPSTTGAARRTPGGSPGTWRISASGGVISTSS